MPTPPFCDNCSTPVLLIEAEIEGWFKAVTPNVFNKGTVTEGLLQRRQLCRACAQLMIDTNRHPAKELPKC